MEQPTKEAVIKAYNIAREIGADSTCKVLEALYPSVDFESKDNRPVEERIMTFVDAVAALGDDHPYVQMYRDIYDKSEKAGATVNVDVVAYLKLRIIVAALNEGWEPQFVEGELRWYPWFYLYTYEEMEKVVEEWKQSHPILPLDNYRVVGRTGSLSGAYGGLVYAYAVNASLISGTGLGSRLAFKSKELAEYAGKQFIEIYADMNIGVVSVKAGEEGDDE